MSSDFVDFLFIYDIIYPTGTTPITKNSIIVTKGMIPMTKNINVTDKTGKIIGSTYPKRALGLVKKDRAQWINENTICLCARYETEDKKMADNLYDVIDNQLSKMQQQLENSDLQLEQLTSVNGMILETMTKLKEDENKNSVINAVKEQLDFIKEDLAKTADIDFLGNENGKELFLARETTKQRMLDTMELLIHDTMSPNTPIPPKVNQTEI